MKTAKNTHVYVGLGTLVFVLGTAFVVNKLLHKNKLKPKSKKMTFIDFTIFDSPDSQGSGSCIDEELVYKLKRLESKTGYPIFEWINSGVRTSFWNKKVGGVSNSSHQIPSCKAVDIKALNTTIRNKLVITAREVGFRRIGVGRTFVHLDVDSSKSQNVAWGYPSGSRPPINPFV